MKVTRTIALLTGLAAVVFPAAAQVFDNSGNGMLNGSYYFRELSFTSTDAVVVYGNINFSSGTYTITGAQGLDCNQSSCSGPSPYTSSGTYSISASGYGFISNQLFGNSIYGSVGANGVFLGSQTEGGNNDLFIAAPLSGQNSGTLQGTYSIAYMDPTGLIPGVAFDALLQMSPNGAGTIGNVNVSAYATSSSASTQTISNVKYIFSNGAYVLQFPSSQTSSALVQGNEYLYSTPDGSFVFGGSPQNFDMFVGVRTNGVTPSFTGLNYTAGMDLDNTSNNFDTYYGTLSASNGVIIGHQRLQYGGVAAQDYTYSDTYTAGSGSFTDTGTNTQYYAGSNGTRIGLGIGPFIGISASVPAPTLTGSGVYLNPAGVVNAASFAPFTAGLSRGELITLTGTNIGPSSLQVAATIPFPTKLGNVQVLINNVAAPLYYVSANQISAIVPWETNSTVVPIQVVNNGVQSNIVTEYLNKTTPGIFTIPADGVSYAAAEHTNFSLVSPSSPAQPGETISVYVSGLGDVSPGVSDGQAGVVDSTTNAIAATIGGVSAPITYAGLAPGLAGLYQLNLTIPTGLNAGDNFLSIGANDGTTYTMEALISIGTGSTSSVTEGVAPVRASARPANARHPRAIRVR